MLKNAQNRAQTIPTPDEIPADFCDPNWDQVSTTLVKSPGRFFFETCGFALGHGHTSEFSSFNAFHRMMKSPQQQMNQGHVATNLFRDKLQHHRRPRSEELQENCQDTANVPIDTIAYRKHFPVHHDRYLEDPQAMQRYKRSEPTEPSCIDSSRDEDASFQLTQRMMHAEAEGRIDKACAAGSNSCVIK
ncbi:hypothetical protein SARC_04895 [Sphaeroforma arctica JP610]|uniref:Uncharacterized protein n=1 Tax=Sphaeroforma arctica JP610 TaxID=667725 RepID=A0A0L0G1W2_9EUKA|nr:hypothetical protein SARC_04895 [Sphaeroforma arctica JP610]KNC82829.1 hypothetical protein SARC_04895 [Sphaeroforma arctica JP610]|eukprot:XP_014156731.1 hypothetical protein SARC_04895 [Sphaeroforma arctica JP610]